MDEKELAFILAKGEGQLVEFKETFTTSLRKEIVAFSNSNGGRIFLGVRDDGIVKGMKLTNHLISQIQDMATNLDPSVLIHISEFANIVIIEVPEGNNKPYSCSDGFFVRVGPNSQKLSRDEILQFSIHEGRISFDEQINKDFTYPDDFDEKKLAVYLEKAHLEKNLDVQTILLNLGVARILNAKIQFTNCGVLFFAKNPSKFFLSSKIVCAEYLGNEKVKILDRKIYDDGIIENITQSIQFIEKRIKNEFVIKSLEREEVLQFPKEVFREAVVNAIMHRDYFDKSADIMVEVYKNKLVIFNPGGLVSWLKPEEFGKISKTRNSLIASLLSRTIFSEKMGTGIKRMRDAMVKHGLQEPTFEFFEHSFYIELVDKKLGSKEGSKEGSKLGSKLTQNQQKIVDLMKHNPHITKKDIIQSLNIGKTAVDNNIAKLKTIGILKRIGPDKGGHWEIVK